MTRFGFLIVVGLVFLVILALSGVTRRDTTQRAPEIFTEMVYSKAAESFSPSADFANGQSMQPLVPGTVIRGSSYFPYGDSSEEAERAGRELTNPFSVDDSQALSNGQQAYAIYCALCHDAAGTGRGPVVLGGMIPPPSLHAIRAKQMADGQMFHILTRGQGNMAPYASQLTPSERWKVILYVRKLQKEASE